MLMASDISGFAKPWCGLAREFTAAAALAVLSLTQICPAMRRRPLRTAQLNGPTFAFLKAKIH